MATYSSLLACRIPWTKEPGGLQSTGTQSHIQLKWLCTHAWTVAKHHVNRKLDSNNQWYVVILWLINYPLWITVIECSLNQMSWKIGCLMKNTVMNIVVITGNGRKWGMGSFDCPGELAVGNNKILGINTLAKITLKKVEISMVALKESCFLLSH